ncbi:3-oxoacyl-[acyl-carrier-protein] reductase [[Clostridium] spiroforme]|nr:3-oxoacyl-[acyl-carrier-protein] reductase [Thomasclavelia spiroformis]
MKLDHKVALVTGGGQGIGKAIALKLASEGADIIINYIDLGNNKEIAEEAKKKVEQCGVKCTLMAANVASFDETKAMFDQIKKEFGRIDIVINNAGITRDNLILRMKEADFDSVIDVNLKGTFNCMKHATKMMMKQKYGRIVSLSSVVGVMGNAGQVNYSASKAGIIGMTMSLAREVGSRGITVNAVAPGFIKTAMTDVLSDEVKAQMLSQIPLGSLGEVDDIANTVLFLASDDAKYITGQTIHVDGGMAM